MITKETANGKTWMPLTMVGCVELKHPNPHMSSQENEGMKKHSQVQYAIYMFLHKYF
jgi:hypothetical protein